jgi:biopolymer transport protein ExbD
MAGGGSSRTDEGKKKARIEIIPLIDVIFFLLATFVLFTLSLDKISSLPVTLPVSNPTPAPPNPNDVTLQVSDADTMYWNREPLELATLAGRLKQYKETVPVADQRVLIAGDSLASFASTIKAIDAVREAGITFSVDTRTTETGK